MRPGEPQIETAIERHATPRTRRESRSGRAKPQPHPECREFHHRTVRRRRPRGGHRYRFRRPWRPHLVLALQQQPRRRAQHPDGRDVALEGDARGQVPGPHRAERIDHGALGGPAHGVERRPQVPPAAGRHHHRAHRQGSVRHAALPAAPGDASKASAAATTWALRTRRMQSSVPRGQCRPPCRPHGRQARSASTTVARRPQARTPARAWWRRRSPRPAPPARLRRASARCRSRPAPRGGR